MNRRLVTVVAFCTTALLVTACSTITDSSKSANKSPSAWKIDGAKSNLNFVTTKAGQPGVAAISETQVFKRFAGGLDAQGKMTLMIDLASVDTGVEIRDERMRTMLWNVKATPQAIFTAQLGATALASINSTSDAGGGDVDVAGELQMAGQTKPITAKLRVNRVGTNQLLVVTRSPIIVNSNDFGLKAGVEALREVMGLNVLSPSAPVNFALQLSQ
jgi:polyisoprenoid-binding protein YceI